MLIIVHLITGLETGGAERMLSRLVAHSDRGRFRSVVVSMTDPGNMASAVDQAGVELMTLGARRGVPDPRALLRFDRILRALRPDILQTWLYHADALGLLAKRCGRLPHLVWNIRCSDANLSPVVAALRRILSWSSAVPDAVIVNSHAGRRFHEKLGYRPRRWEYVPNGFDTSELRPNPLARRRLRAEIGADADTVVIGLPARHHPMKDHATFLAAAATLAAAQPKVRYALVGSGIDPSNRALVETIARFGLARHVRLLGERKDMAAVYAALDIAVLSSSSGEGFPNVLGEAMACGLPCVGTDNGDTPELIGNTGIIVPPRNPAALAAALEELLALGPDARRSLGDRARLRIIRDFDLGSVVSRYEALYEDVLVPGRSAAHCPETALRPAVAGVPAAGGTGREQGDPRNI
jgi:glycosyltransferase involved in cell wall biosynthesis